LTSFVARVHGMFLNTVFISRQGRLLFAKTIEVFLVHLPSFPYRPYTRANFPCPKAGMTNFGTRLLGKETFLSVFLP
jgi:hypothetical protein